LLNVKRVNIANSKLKSIVDFYKQKNIMTYHEFVLGLPGETKQSWIDGLSEIVDINPDGYIYGHWAEAYANTELMDPIYMESFQIKVKRLPVVSFWTCSDDNITKEFGWYVTETYSMVESEYKDCFVFLKFLVAVHSLGWARSIGETTARHYDIKLSDFYKTFYQWCLDNQQSLLGQHMQQIKSHLEIVFSGQQGWGQTIFGNNDIRWDYCSWLGIVIERNRFMFFQDLQKFLEQYYNQLQLKNLLSGPATQWGLRPCHQLFYNLFGSTLSTCMQRDPLPAQYYSGGGDPASLSVDVGAALSIPANLFKFVITDGASHPSSTVGTLVVEGLELAALAIEASLSAFIVALIRFTCSGSFSNTRSKRSCSCSTVRLS
jgi:hypothetical protein